MSWLFKTLSSDKHGVSTTPAASDVTAKSPAGVKEDLSAIGHTIGRQLRGVAAFLAPPPVTESKVVAESSSNSEANSEALSGLRSDLAEIGGSLKSSLTIFSSNGNKAVGEISRLASNFLPFPSRPEGEEYSDDEENEFDGYGYGGEDYVPGITDDVLQFVTEISDRPECWTDFPLRLDHGFTVSDAQREHATTIEQYIPKFAALRKRLCTSMNEEVFWMIYFILLVPRLRGHDSELLSTHEIVKARDGLLQKLRKKEAESQAQIPVCEIQSLEQDFPELRVSEEANAEQSSLDKLIYESGNSSAADLRFETEDDISFSDLEDNDGEVSLRSMANKGSGSVPGGSNDWVQLNESSQRKKDSEGEDSSGWLNVDDYD